MYQQLTDQQTLKYMETTTTLYATDVNAHDNVRVHISVALCIHCICVKVPLLP